MSCRTSRLLLVCSALGLLPCFGGEDTDSPYVPAGYVRTFTENFSDEAAVFNRTDHPRFTTGHFRLNADDLNTSRRLGNNRERQLYVDRDFIFEGVRLGIDPFEVKDGILSITARPLSDRHRALLAPLANEEKNIPPVIYSSGLLSTETQLREDGHGFQQLYGYWELRAKLPAGKGLWPAFWLVAETWDYWDEVDIFEVLGHEPKKIYHATHLAKGGGTDDVPWSEKTYERIDTSDGFHVYGLLMTEETVAYFVDGVKTLEVPHQIEVPLYTIVNLAVGGSWPGDPDETTKFPATMEIDYLRVYQKRGR